MLLFMDCLYSVLFTGVEVADKLLLFGHILNGFWNSVNYAVSAGHSLLLHKCPSASTSGWGKQELLWIWV
jgi:hypothetical protein